SEMNHSKTEPMRFIQMWILPSRRGLPPSVEQRSFPADERRNAWRPVGVPAEGFGGAGAPADGAAVTVHQDAAVYASLIEPGQRIQHRFRPGFGGYLFVVHGDASLKSDGETGGTVDEGGAAKIRDVPELSVEAGPKG